MKLTDPPLWLDVPLCCLIGVCIVVLIDPPPWLAVPLCCLIGGCIVPALVILKHIINP